MKLFLGGWKLIEKAAIKEYQKPELTYIDDPAFDEMGQGSSGFYPRGNNGNYHGSNNGNHYGGGYGGGKNHK
jgi:hypothetical protein